MSQRRRIGILVAVATARTGVGGVTLFNAGGGGHGSCVIVGSFRNGHVKVEAAVGGSLPGVAACAGSSTGSCLGYFVGIVCGIQLRQGHRSCAGAAGAGARQLARRRGRGCGGDLVAVAVTQCGGIAILVAVTTDTASVGGVASHGAGGCCDSSFVAVIGGRNAFRLFVTASAAGIGLYTLCNAGGRFGDLSTVPAMA